MNRMRNMRTTEYMDLKRPAKCAAARRAGIQPADHGVSMWGADALAMGSSWTDAGRKPNAFRLNKNLEKSNHR